MNEYHRKRPFLHRMLHPKLSKFRLVSLQYKTSDYGTVDTHHKLNSSSRKILIFIPGKIFFNNYVVILR